MGGDSQQRAVVYPGARPPARLTGPMAELLLVNPPKLGKVGPARGLGGKEAKNAPA